MSICLLSSTFPSKSIFTKLFYFSSWTFPKLSFLQDVNVKEPSTICPTWTKFLWHLSGNFSSISHLSWTLRLLGNRPAHQPLPDTEAFASRTTHRHHVCQGFLPGTRWYCNILALAWQIFSRSPGVYYSIILQTTFLQKLYEQVSISPTFTHAFFRTKVLHKVFLYLHFRLELIWHNNIGENSLIKCWWNLPQLSKPTFFGV
jgi:hypothetical protein